MSENKEFQTALLRLTDQLVKEYAGKVQHTKPLIRASLNRGFIEGVTQTLKALERMKDARGPYNIDEQTYKDWKEGQKLSTEGKLEFIDATKALMDEAMKGQTID